MDRTIVTKPLSHAWDIVCGGTAHAGHMIAEITHNMPHFPNPFPDFSCVSDALKEAGREIAGQGSRAPAKRETPRSWKI